MFEKNFGWKDFQDNLLVDHVTFIISHLIEIVFIEQEKFPSVEEELQTLKGTEELGFQTVVKP